MKTLEVQVDEQSLERARRVVEGQQITLEALPRGVIERMGAPAGSDDPYLGMFADEPDLVDSMLESAMRASETHALRAPNGQIGSRLVLDNWRL